MTLGPFAWASPASGALPFIFKTLPPLNYLALIPTRLYFRTHLFY